jgi:uncharacterized membrane protein
MTGRTSALLTGIISGVRFATKSLEPSLMPRSAIDQGLIMGGSFLTGFLAGSTAGRVVSFVPLPGSSAAIRAIGVAAAAGRSAQLLAHEEDTDLPKPDEGEAWAEAGAEVLSAMALSGIGSHKDPPIMSTATLAAVGASTAVEARAALHHRSDNPDPKYIATATGVALGLNAVLAALVVAVGLTARTIGKRAPKRAPVQAIVTTAAAVGIVAGLGAAARIGVSKLLGKIAAGNRATEISYATPPTSVAVSGSQYSLAPYDTLGLQGRRLVSEYTRRDDIEMIMGEPAKAEPVRVYVGLGTADDEDERTEIAIQELRRAGGFDRSMIIAASPAGTGYVNYIAVEAAELMTRGDVATIAVQYGEVPSMLSINKVADAARVYAKLVRRLRAEIDVIDRDVRLAAYGESLGAITCQMGVLSASESITDLAVHNALWAGTPQGSELFRELTTAGVPVFDHFDDVHRNRDTGIADPHVFFLNHDNDPVTKANPKIAYEMPSWLQTAETGRNMEPNQRWMPGVSFWQTLIDTKNAATVVPGEFKSTGHDYRADLAEFVRAAYGFTDVTDEQMERIEERLRSSEIRRAERIAEGRVEAQTA